MPRPSLPTSALYVRLPTAEADKLNRAARALGVPKTVLVTGLVTALADPAGAAQPAAGAPVAPAGDAPRVGVYSFHPHDPPEVLTPEQAGHLLQLAASEVVELAQSGELPGRLLGGAWRFSRAGLLAWLTQGTDRQG